MTALTELPLRITYSPDSVHVTGTPEQLKRLFDLAIDSAHSNVALSRPTLHTSQQELTDLRSIRKEWFPS